MASYGFKFMACVIPNANHFHHADDSDHPLNAHLYIISNNILTIYIKLHFKLYKICYMKRPGLRSLLRQIAIWFHGQIFKQHLGWCHVRWWPILRYIIVLSMPCKNWPVQILEKCEGVFVSLKNHLCIFPECATTVNSVYSCMQETIKYLFILSLSYL